MCSRLRTLRTVGAVALVYARGKHDVRRWCPTLPEHGAVGALGAEELRPEEEPRLLRNR